MQQKLLTIPEVCLALNYGKSSVYKLIKNGQLHCVKLGKRSLISQTALNQFIENLPSYNGGRS